MLNASRSLHHEVVVFVGPLNLTGYEAVHKDEIAYLTELAVEAGAIVGGRVNNLTTLVVTSELTDYSLLNTIPKTVTVMNEAEFIERYLPDTLTGEAWE